MHPLEYLAQKLGFTFKPIGRFWTLESGGKSVVFYFSHEDKPIVSIFLPTFSNTMRGEDAQSALVAYAKAVKG